MSSQLPLFEEDIFKGHLVNIPSKIVSDTLLGMSVSNPNVGILDCGNVVVRRDYAEHNIVQVVSGGPSGHEPFQAGFVGKGMLCAAVQGDMFRSPPVHVILKTIKQISYNLTGGVLVIVRNNTSDCLNFGLAVERARNRGIGVEMIVVNDEFCVVNKQQGKRGSSGIVLINKIAGAMADKLLPLNTISDFCKRLLENMGSILFTIKTSHLADECVCSTQSHEYEIEIGTGLHGEKGLLVIDKTDVHEVTSFILTQLSRFFPISPNVVILVNNLGNSLLLEEMSFVNEIVNYLFQREIHVLRMYHGKYLTSPKVRGFSLTILNVFDNDILSYMDHPCEAPGWGYVSTKPLEDLSVILCRPIKRPPVKSLGPQLTQQQRNTVYYAVQFACDALISCERQINIIDCDEGRGNVGTKMKRGAAIVLDLMKNRRLDFARPKCWFEILGQISERHVGGAIGSSYSILFEVASIYFGDQPEDLYVEFHVWLKCLKEAILVIKQYGNTQFGFGTMYDPLFVFVETINMLPEQTKSMELFRLSLKYVEDAVLQTKQGSRKYVDPGAEVVRVWIKAIYEGLSLPYN
ncbi:hypothetical protein PPYR_09609 [Photinus pyralis]|uniref:Triokinase/FMN cyclase n=2 Tax=Photinus pyralis TaxID=7054 RepID=A0A5N4AMT4_PHOPY|nr:hypothetical protein PPYR_09609 [Photinus pyralis]